MRKMILIITAILFVDRAARELCVNGLQIGDGLTFEVWPVLIAFGHVRNTGFLLGVLTPPAGVLAAGWVCFVAIFIIATYKGLFDGIPNRMIYGLWLCVAALISQAADWFLYGSVVDYVGLAIDNYGLIINLADASLFAGVAMALSAQFEGRTAWQTEPRLTRS